MPFIDPETGYLTVINLFKTDQPQRVDQLVSEMCTIVDAADYPGWVSSTVHRGQEKMGTANFIQWRGKQDLESRYAGNDFKHHTIPVFSQITTFVRLMQTEVELSQRHPRLSEATEISPQRDDYTVIEILGVRPDDQGELVAAAGSAHEWLIDEPGYRSQSVLRGIRSRGIRSSGDLVVSGVDNDFVVVYSQWDSKESFDAYRDPDGEQDSPGRRRMQERRAALTTSVDWNTYQVVHTRSAPEPARA